MVSLSIDDAEELIQAMDGEIVTIVYNPNNELHQQIIDYGMELIRDDGTYAIEEDPEPGSTLRFSIHLTIELDDIMNFQVEPPPPPQPPQPPMEEDPQGGRRRKTRRTKKYKSKK